MSFIILSVFRVESVSVMKLLFYRSGNSADITDPVSVEHLRLTCTAVSINMGDGRFGRQTLPYNSPSQSQILNIPILCPFWHLTLIASANPLRRKSQRSLVCSTRVENTSV